jgi:hypothetical protein
MGFFRRTGNGDTGERKFQTLVKKYLDNAIWKVSKIGFGSDKAQYVGAPVKYVIDWEKSQTDAVLQSTTFTRFPIPPDSLADCAAHTKAIGSFSCTGAISGQPANSDH